MSQIQSDRASNAWAIGDLAECIVDEWQTYDGGDYLGPVPQLGGIYLVTRVLLMTFNDLQQELMLSFPEFGRQIFCAGCFKKVKPKGEDRCVPRLEEVPA